MSESPLDITSILNNSESSIRQVYPINIRFLYKFLYRVEIMFPYYYVFTKNLKTLKILKAMFS